MDEAVADPVLRIEISPPLEHGAATFSVLEVREPTVADLQRSETALGAVVTTESALESEVVLVSVVSLWPVEALQELPVSTLDRAAAFAAAFSTPIPDRDADKPVLDIELEAPIVVQKGEFASLRLREPRGSERKRAAKHLAKGVTPASERRFMVALIEEISGWPTAAVLKLPASVYARAGEYLTHFLDSGRRTGASSPPS